MKRQLLFRAQNSASRDAEYKTAGQYIFPSRLEVMFRHRPLNLKTSPVTRVFASQYLYGLPLPGPE